MDEFSRTESGRSGLPFPDGEENQSAEHQKDEDTCYACALRPRILHDLAKHEGAAERRCLSGKGIKPEHFRFDNAIGFDKEYPRKALKPLIRLLDVLYR